MIDQHVHLSFRDVLLVPYDIKPCAVMSRNDPDISTSISKNVTIKVPILSSPMDTVTDSDMCIALDQCGALGIHTRYINNEQERSLQIESITKMKQHGVKNIAMAIGVHNAYDNAAALVNAGANIICVDIANGNHVLMLKALNELDKLKQQYTYLSIIAGNVASGPAALRLAEAGASAVKIGIGSGAACSTRMITGFGVPQLYAIKDCAQRVNGLAKIIADGGIRESGDIVKALWAGADAVMLGYVLSGHDQCPIVMDDKLGKGRIYRGMSSRSVSRRADVAAEGVCVTVPHRGDVKNTISEYAAAIRAGLSMGNAMTLSELRENVEAIRVSTMSQTESDPVKSLPAE